MGYTVYGSPGTADFYRTFDDQNPLQITSLEWPGEEETIQKYLASNNIQLCIITPSKTTSSSNASSTTSNSSTNSNSSSKKVLTRGYLVRRSALDFNIPLITNIKFAKMLIDALLMYRIPSVDLPIGRYDQRDSRRMVIIPGLIDVHVHVREPGNNNKTYIHRKIHDAYD